VVVGSWTGQFDRSQAERVLSGRDPFDEVTFASGDDLDGGAWDDVPADTEVADSHAMAVAGR
jgi:aerobic C4-dicarboxylate transport protein